VGKGGIIDVEEDVAKAVKFLQMPHVPGEAWPCIQQAKSAAHPRQAQTKGCPKAPEYGVRSMYAIGNRSGRGIRLMHLGSRSRADLSVRIEPWR